MWWLWIGMSLADPQPVCPVRELGGHVVTSGQAYGRRRELALQSAEDQARQAAQAALCTGFPADGFRCTYLMRHAMLLESSYDEKDHVACAWYSFLREKHDSFERDTAALKVQLETLGGQLSSQAAKEGKEKHPPIELGVPIWPNGCSVPEAMALQSGLRAGLGKSGTQKLGKGGLRADLHISPGTAGSLAFDVTLVDPRSKLATPVGGFEFPADLLNIDPQEEAHCATDSLVGLRDGEKLGKDDLRVWVDMDSPTGTFCEGVPMALSLRVSRPARVQLYSVLADGTAWLVWPPQGRSEGDLLKSQEYLTGDSALLALRPLTHDQERIVAVAVPQGADFAASEGWSTACKAPRGFNRALYPPDAALGVGKFLVLGPGESGCPTNPPWDREQIQAALESLPIFSVQP